MARLIGVMVVTFMLAVGHAEATCAWVLWEELGTINFEKSTETTDWRITHATPASQDCQKLVGRSVEGRVQTLRAPDGSPAQGLKVEGPRVSLIGGKVAISYTYLCLPDTIDPRGPKGGR